MFMIINNHDYSIQFIAFSQGQQSPESYETMLRKIKDYDPAKYELQRTAAGRDEVGNCLF